jgi:hypothetical protein
MCNLKHVRTERKFYKADNHTVQRYAVEIRVMDGLKLDSVRIPRMPVIPSVTIMLFQIQNKTVSYRRTLSSNRQQVTMTDFY